MNMLCRKGFEEHLVAKVNRFTMFYEAHLSKMLVNNLNIYVNSVAVWKYITQQKKKVFGEFITAFDKNNKLHSVKINPELLVK